MTVEQRLQLKKVVSDLAVSVNTLTNLDGDYDAAAQYADELRLIAENIEMDCEDDANDEAAGPWPDEEDDFDDDDWSDDDDDDLDDDDD